MYRILSALVFILLSASSFAQDFNKAKLDSLMDTLEDNDRFMGTVALVHDGKTVYTRAVGFADRESKVLLTPETKFRIGSISKMFTAALIFQAVEEGKINLDQTIDNYFPGIKNADNITVGNLLNHRSGIFNFTNSEDYLKWNTEAKKRKELVDIITKGGSVFEPGSKAEYSNSNYVLLTFILEDVYNKPYSELIDNKIIKPLGLKNTYYGKPANLEKNECYSYSYLGSWKKESETDMSVPVGAGAIVSNPSDLSVFAKALFDGKIISNESLSKMTTINDNYGMGIFKFPFYDRYSYGHTGGIDGFSSMLSFFPEDKLSVALVSNGSRFDNNEIVVALLSAWYGKPFEIPTFKEVSVSEEEIIKYIGNYSSENFPLKIDITNEGKVLIAQATGQPSFPLDPEGNGIFSFKRAGVVLEFYPEEKKMVLKQGGGVFTFFKD